MKRCPKCNRTYATNTQRFCTQDGMSLVTVEAHQGETIRIDSAQLKDFDDEETKVISRDLVPEGTADFDPFKTVMAQPERTAGIPNRDTQDLVPPASTSTSLPTSGSISASQPGSSSAPLPGSSSAPLPAEPAADSGTLSSLPPEPGMQTIAVPLPKVSSAPLVTPPPPSVATLSTAAVAQSPKAKSKLPLILGILAMLLILGIGGAAAAFFLIVKPALEKGTTAKKEEPTPEPSVAPTPKEATSPREPEKKLAVEPPPYSPPADAVQFVNSKANLDGKLAEHYVDFSFYYPNRWVKDPKAGVPGASNFAKVEKRLPPDFTQENFAVGWYSSAGSEQADSSLFHKLAQSLSSQLEQKYPEYQQVSEGPTKVGVYDAYEFRFESISRNTEKGDVTIWGRVILVPPVDGSKNGVTLLMLATSLAPEVKSIDDVGEKGDLPMLLQSFRFGTK